MQFQEIFYLIFSGDFFTFFSPISENFDKFYLFWAY